MEKTIMIVDDALFMRKLIIKTLTKHGYHHIIEATNGEEGISLYKQHQPDIVLLDITMPDKTGIDVLQELLMLDADAKVIMCSAVGQDNMIANALRIGAKDFIVKPYKDEQLIQMIDTLII
ncbi:response regulator [[Eubacterium] hominis]|uniref:response regulator n=1 Tax=[Eubacterium] hominis TaxID=2764325 RepID=UPI003A4E4357